MHRRNYLAGPAGAAALLAGCTGSGSNDDGETSSGSGGHTAAIEPMGEVTFDAVPKTWVVNNGSWADMGIALG